MGLTSIYEQQFKEKREEEEEEEEKHEVLGPNWLILMRCDAKACARNDQEMIGKQMPRGGNSGKNSNPGGNSRKGRGLFFYLENIQDPGGN